MESIATAPWFDVTTQRCKREGISPVEWSCSQWPIHLTWMLWSLPFPFLSFPAVHDGIRLQRYQPSATWTSRVFIHGKELSPTFMLHPQYITFPYWSFSFTPFQSIQSLMNGVEWNLMPRNRERFSQNLSAFRRELNSNSISLVPIAADYGVDAMF